MLGGAGFSRNRGICSVVVLVAFVLSCFNWPGEEIARASPDHPVILGISPNPVRGANFRQWLTISGTGFSSGCVVTLTTEGQRFIIPPGRTKFVNWGEVRVFVNTTAERASWTVQVTNPDGQESNQFGFTVLAPEDVAPVVTVVLNGEVLDAPSPPVIEGGRTLVSVRAIAERLGRVAWDGPTQTITVTRGGTIVRMRINDKKALVNGREVMLDVAPCLRDGLAFVPVRFLAEALGVDVFWDPAGVVAVAERSQLQQTIDVFRRDWMELYGKIELPSSVSRLVNRFAPGLVEKADELCHTGVDLHTLALLNLNLAEWALKAGDLELCRKYLDRAVRFRVLGNESVNTAYQVFPSAVEATVRKIMELPFAVGAELAGFMLPGPGQALARWGIAGRLGWAFVESYLGYAVDVAARGKDVDEASRGAVGNWVVSAFFEFPAVSAAMDVLVKDPLQKYVGRRSGLYQLLEQHLRNQEVRVYIMRKAAEAADLFSSKLAQARTRKLIDSLYRTVDEAATLAGEFLAGLAGVGQETTGGEGGGVAPGGEAAGDTTPPLLVVASHADGQTVSTGTIILTGIATDAGRGDQGITSVTVNGLPASGGTVSGSGTAIWSQIVTLQEGTNLVRIVARDGRGNAVSADITLSYVPAQSRPLLALSTTSLSGSVTQGGNTPSQSFEIWSSGGGSLSYSIADDAGWLSCTPSTGTCTSNPVTIMVNYATGELPSGEYLATITVTAPDASNSPQILRVHLTVVPSRPSQPVLFPDAVLEQAIRESLGKPQGPITTRDLSRLTRLAADGPGIENLAGLEHAVNLQELDIYYRNRVQDLSPIAGLTGLRRLNLYDCQIGNIAPLAGLRNLESLNLQSNQVADLSPLAMLTNLKYLNLSANPVSDLSPLRHLTGLENLVLGDNQIADISALAGLRGLRGLWISGNGIREITPLVRLTGLETLNLARNQIEDISALAGLPGLRDVDLSGNGIADISALAGLLNLRYLDLRNNQIRDVSALVSNMSRGGLGSGDRVDLRYNRLDLGPDSPAARDIQTLSANGVIVDCEPQR